MKRKEAVEQINKRLKALKTCVRVREAEIPYTIDIYAEDPLIDKHSIINFRAGFHDMFFSLCKDLYDIKISYNNTGSCFFCFVNKESFFQ